ncbi:MAG: hypothetical protein L0220_17110, partial [Acidobacteria bacterium]|nr:hypothetical protein [Acidobacteriota bacterium]
MTIDEITRTLQTVAENQAQTTQRQAELEATVQEIAQFHQQALRNHEVRQAHFDEAFKMLIELARIQEGRIDGHDEEHKSTDEKLNALIGTHVGYDSRQALLETAVQQVAVSYQMIVELIQIQEERIDGHDEMHKDTDARLNALIDSQIRVGEKVDKLTADITAVNGRVDRIDERLDRMSERAEAHDQQLIRIGEQLTRIDERLNQVVSLQAENAKQMIRTDDQIRALVAAQASNLRKPK